MGMNKTSDIKPVLLRAAFQTDLAACWQHARSLHPDETPYAFVLYGLEGIPHLYPHVLTEEGLTRVAQRYLADGHYDTLDEARKALRYSMADSPYAAELEDKLPNVDALLEPIEEDLEEEDGYGLLARSAIAAFTVLAKKGTFGQGKPREHLLLMIDTSLAGVDWSKPSIKRLNSSAALRRYEAETKIVAPYASSDALAVSADGRSVYFSGNRASKPKRAPNIEELVGCDVVGTRLKRRWQFNFRGSHIALGPNGTVFAVRAKSGKGTTVVLRLPEADRTIRHEIQVQDLPAALAVCHKTGRIAVATHDTHLRLINAKLEVTHSSRLEWKASSLHFLKTGELLAATEQGIVSFDAQLKLTPTTYRRDAFHISLDQTEKFCVASTIDRRENRVRSKPLGFDLLSFPKMEVIRTFKVDSYQLGSATLSPDGKRVACVATQCTKPQSSFIVFETGTGREIGRRKSPSIIPQMAFLPGQDVLVGTTFGYIKGEAVILWPLPKLS
ncbi:MAG: hypothetical protein JWM68_1146 [Verrucomicrobiales bacterium]|nr:hypothetical protein [Verrucomicrobiales bacterium]